jgi:hypothetical protein
MEVLDKRKKYAIIWDESSPTASLEISMNLVIK